MHFCTFAIVPGSDTIESLVEQTLAPFDESVNRRGLYCLETCNPDGMWDWYQIGGRRLLTPSLG